jgi:hypothetical protein
MSDADETNADMNVEQLTAGEKALLQTMRRDAVRNVLLAILIGGVATAARLAFTRGWVRWLLLGMIILWVGGCIRVACKDMAWVYRKVALTDDLKPMSAEEFYKTRIGKKYLDGSIVEEIREWQESQKRESGKE